MNTDNGSLSFDIRLALDRLRRDVASAKRQFSSIGMQAQRTGTQIDSGMDSLSRSVSGHIRQMVGGVKSAFADMAKNMLGISALVGSGAFLKDLFNESKAFAGQMKVVATISEEVAGDLEGYKQRVLDLCTQIAVAPETAAAALYQINSAGHLGADGMRVLEASAKAAVGGVTETAIAADAITTILNAYRFKAYDAEAISDKLFTTVRLGKTTMDELGRSIAYVAPLAATYKISIDEVLAAVAQLTKQGNSTQNAMTQISASIQAVASEIGDTAFENGLMAALGEIEKRADGSNAALKAQLSNIRAVRGALGLTKENAAETAAFVDQIRNSTGAAAQAAEMMGNGTAAEMRKLRTNFLKELKDFGDGMTKTLSGLSAYMNRAFESGDMQQVLKTVKELVVAYGAYKAIIIICTALTKVYKSTLAQMAVQQALATASQHKLTKAQALGTVVTMNLQRAMKALWAGIGGWVGVIATAAFAIYKFCTRTTEAEKAQKRLSQAISTSSTEASNEKREIEKLLNILKTAKKESQEYKDAKQRIIDQYGQYLQGIINEKGEITNLGEAYRILAEQVTRAAKARALESLNTDAATALAESNKSASDRLAAALKQQGLDEQTIQSIVSRASTSIAETGIVPEDILRRYGKNITNEGFEAAFSKYYMESDDFRGSADERQKRLDTLLPKLRESAQWKQGIGSYDDMIMALHSMGFVNAPEKITRMDSQGYLGSSEVNAALQEFVNAQKTFADNTARNEQSLNLGARDRSQFEDIDPDRFAADLEYLKNTVLTKMVNGGYGKGGVNFRFSGGKQQTFKTEEELRTFIQQMELELRDRQTAAMLGNQGEGGERGEGGGDAKTLAQAIAKMIADSKTVTDVSEIAALKEKMKDALEKGLKVGDESLTTDSKDYNDLKAAYEALRKRAPGAAGEGGESQEQLNAKVIAARQQGLNLELAQNAERVRLLSEQELQLQEELAKAMEEGAEKRIRLQELAAQRQLLELEGQMHSELQAVIDGEKARFDAQEQLNAAQAAASGNKNYAPKTFTAGLLNPGDLSMGDTVVDTQNTGNLTAEAIAEINRLLSHYKQLQDAVTANTAKELDTAAQNTYDEYLRNFGTFLQKRQAIRDIADRAYAAAATEGERMSIRTQEKRDLAELDMSHFKESNDWGKVFADMGNVATSALQDLNKRIEQFINTQRDLKPDEIRELRDAMEQIRSVIGDRAPWDALASSFQALTKANKDVKAAQEAYNMAVKQGTEAEQTQAQATLNAAKSAKQKALNEATKAIKNAVGQMQQYIGVASALTDMLGAFGIDIPPELEGFIGGLGEAVSGLESMDLTRPFSMVTGLIKGIAGIGKAIGALFNHDAAKEKRIAKLDEQIKDFDHAYEQLAKSMDKAYGSDSAKILEKQNKLLEQKRDAIKKQIAEEYSKKDYDRSRIAEWRKELDNINAQIADNKEAMVDAIFGEDVKTAISNFADAYASMFDGGISKAKASKNIVRDMIKKMIVEAMKADLSAPMEQIRNMLNGYFTDGVISDYEEQAVESYVEGVLAEQSRKWGWADKYFKDANSQDGGSRGGFTAMSQDTADELNGRFTAIQMDSAHNRASLDSINATLTATMAGIADMRSHSEEMRNLSLTAINHLEAISRNTRELYEVNERLAKIEKYTSRL